MELKNFTKKVIFKGDHSNIETLIKEVYGQSYEIMPMEEIGSSQYNAVHSVNVKEKPLDEYQVEDIVSLLNGKPNQYILNTIMQDLCNRGFLEPGEYLMDVSW